MSFLYGRSSTKKCRRTLKNNEMEAFIRFRGVHLHLYFLKAFIYNEMKAYIERAKWRRLSNLESHISNGPSIQQKVLYLI